MVGALMNVIICGEGNLLAMDGAWEFDLLPLDGTVIGAQLASRTSAKSEATQQSAGHLEDIQKLLRIEWEFTTEKIHQNFSNGSAFHYRSKLLPLLIQFDKASLVSTSAPSKTPSDWFQEELEIIRNAVFTEPDDQTSWWYFRFILAWANPKNGEECDEEALEGFRRALYEEWNTIKELVEGEGGACKWGLLGLHMIASTFCMLEEGNQYEGEDWSGLSKSYLVELKALDPDRSRRYDAMMMEG